MVRVIERYEADFAVIAFFVMIAAFALYALTPAERWYDVTKFQPHNGATWQEVTLDLERDLKREFQGAYLCSLRSSEDNINWVSERFGAWVSGPYRTENVLPEVIKASKWCAGSLPENMALAPRLYEWCITWRINENSLFFQRDTEACGFFTITPA